MQKYKMQIGLSVLDHLGINLYSNYAAVLSEVIANAWDADAGQIEISIKQEEIKILDDGNGMNSDDLNEKYLRVGYSKRIIEGNISPGGRLLMGRKGIGKLSLFSIANKIEIHTKKQDNDSVAILLERSGIDECVKNNQDYAPVAIDPEPLCLDQCEPYDHGTIIILTQLNLKRSSVTSEALYKRIARRFSVIGTEEFKVLLNQREITQSDREDFMNLEYVWTFGECKMSNTQAKKINTLDDIVNPDITDCSKKEDLISGWIGTSAKPSSLSKDKDDNLNSIVVLARGRLIQENILQAINDGRVYTKYITGTLNADFLDISSADDIATSDRQRIIEDDERYKSILQKLRLALNEIGNRWTELRKDDGLKNISKQIPEIQEWIDSFQGDTKKHAKETIGLINTLTIDDMNKKREIYKYSILAFERLRLREEISKLPEIIKTGHIDSLLAIFCRIDDIEATLYHDITKGRISVIQTLSTLKEENAKESILQKHLFEHLWLLDPSWERSADIPPSTEKSLQKIFNNINADLSEEERRGRVDIQYRKAAGDFIIIELKRLERTLNSNDLMKQGNKYIQATEKFLRGENDNSPIEMIYILGSFPTDQKKEDIIQQLKVKNSKIITYDELISNAEKAYMSYLGESKRLDRINDLVNKIGQATLSE